MRLVVACGLAAALCLATPAAAAGEPPVLGQAVVVKLMSGATFRGVLVGQDHRTVTIRSGAGTVRELPLTSVNSVVRDEPAAGAAEPQDTAAPAVAMPATDGPAAAAAPSRRDTAATSAAAASPGGDGFRTRVGLGVSLPGAGEFPSFYVPIQVNPDFRLEPELGMVRMSVSGSSVTALQLGLGLLGTWPVAPQVGGYAGVRAQVQRLDATGGEGITNVRVAAALGGEWLPVPAVALGAEGQLAYVSLDKAISGNGATASGFATGALLFLRVYLR